MTSETRRKAPEALRTSRGLAGRGSVLAMSCMICLVPYRGVADDREDNDCGNNRRYCSATATAVFRASPTPGEVYIEECSLGNAEDMTEVLSTAYAFGNDPELYGVVPQQLAERLCANDWVVTKNFSLREPGVFARKYYSLPESANSERRQMMKVQ